MLRFSPILRQEFLQNGKRKGNRRMRGHTNSTGLIRAEHNPRIGRNSIVLSPFSPPLSPIKPNSFQTKEHTNLAGVIKIVLTLDFTSFSTGITKPFSPCFCLSYNRLYLRFHHRFQYRFYLVFLSFSTGIIKSFCLGFSNLQ